MAKLYRNNQNVNLFVFGDKPGNFISPKALTAKVSSSSEGYWMENIGRTAGGESGIISGVICATGKIAG